MKFTFLLRPDREMITMIVLLRVDDRLLHGQVAKTWTKKYSVDEILIVSDEVVDDEFSKMTLCLAKPSNVKLRFVGLDKVKEELLESESSEKNVMCITSNFQDMDRVICVLPQTRYVNVGGLRNCQSGENIQITPTVFVTPKDVAIIKKWDENGIQIGIRQIPGEKDIWMDEII